MSIYNTILTYYPLSLSALYVCSSAPGDKDDALIPFAPQPRFKLRLNGRPGSPVPDLLRQVRPRWLLISGVSCVGSFSGSRTWWCPAASPSTVPGLSARSWGEPAIRPRPWKWPTRSTEPFREDQGLREQRIKESLWWSNQRQSHRWKQRSPQQLPRRHLSRKRAQR